ncbi:MAG: 3TM-type holin [Vicingaceae bacterium]
MNNSKIIKETIEGVLNGASGIIDSLPSNDKKHAAKNELTGIVLNNLTKALDVQRDTLVTEMKGNWLQKSWRPILMLCFGFIVMYSKFIAPAFGLSNANLEHEFWTLLELGIGGYVIGRSVEKIGENVTKNIDLSFLKKKDRKI